jgi:A/G-specific adenine glycosylase
LITTAEFQRIILDFYAQSGRHLPWRYTGKANPWGVLVSEYMLQQTQISRVVSFWERWMKLWPRPSDLAAAPLEQVLKEWSGLGYNRRAKNLWNCAAILAEKYNNKIPRKAETLATLPGIGQYTAGAIACFAWNKPAIFIETNIRSVLIHFFFQGKTGINDKELYPILERILDYDNPRIWYWALMDYGAELKKVTGNPNRKSAVYAKQSRFEGSFRQIRGAVVKTLSVKGPHDKARLYKEVEKKIKTLDKAEYKRALSVLQKEQMVAEEGGVYRIN